MGAAATILSAETQKPLDASDITDLAGAKSEIIRLRLLASKHPSCKAFKIDHGMPSDASDIETLDTGKAQISTLRTKVLRQDCEIKLAELTASHQKLIEERSASCKTAAKHVAKSNSEMWSAVKSISSETVSKEMTLVFEVICMLMGKKKPTKLSTAQKFFKTKAAKKKISLFKLKKINNLSKAKIVEVVAEPKLNLDFLVKASEPLNVMVYRMAKWINELHKWITDALPSALKIDVLEDQIEALKSEDERAEEEMEGRMVVFKALFALMDKDGSGEIDLMEIVQFMLAKQKLKKKEIQEAVKTAKATAITVLQEADTDTAHRVNTMRKIDLKEFAKFMLLVLYAVYHKVDADNSGTVEIEEMEELMRIIHGEHLGLGKKAKEMNKETKKKKLTKKMKVMHKKILKMQDGAKQVDKRTFVDYVLYHMQQDKLMVKKHLFENLLRLSFHNMDWAAAKKDNIKDSSIIDNCMDTDTSGEATPCA